jgi:hypothetical protein
MAALTLTWDKGSPDGTDPVAGQPGHFKYVIWLKAGVTQANDNIAAMNAEIETLKTDVAALKAAAAGG